MLALNGLLIFFEITDKEDREIMIRRSYEKISEFLNKLDINQWKNVNNKK